MRGQSVFFPGCLDYLVLDDWEPTQTIIRTHISFFFQHLQPLSSISVMLGNTLRSWSEWMDPSIACTCGCASLCICPSGYSQPISSQTACCGLLVSHEQPCTVSSISSYSITVITREITLFLFCSNCYGRSDNNSLGNVLFTTEVGEGRATFAVTLCHISVDSFTLCSESQWLGMSLRMRSSRYCMIWFSNVVCKLLQTI